MSNEVKCDTMNVIRKRRKIIAQANECLIIYLFIYLFIFIYFYSFSNLIICILKFYLRNILLKF